MPWKELMSCCLWKMAKSCVPRVLPEACFKSRLSTSASDVSTVMCFSPSMPFSNVYHDCAACSLLLGYVLLSDYCIWLPLRLGHSNRRNREKGTCIVIILTAFFRAAWALTVNTYTASDSLVLGCMSSRRDIDVTGVSEIVGPV